MSRAEKTVSKPKPVGYPEHPQSVGEHIRKKRVDLGISQGAVARQLGVSEDCVCYWEQNRNQPRLYQYPAIIKFLGYYPFDHETETFWGKIKRYKYEHGLSNKKLAKLLGLDASSVASWQNNKHMAPIDSVIKSLRI